VGPNCIQPVQAKFTTPVRCRLCSATIEVLSNFRATTAAQCPHCGLKFTFDPQGEPLPVRGLTLHWDAVREAAHRQRPSSAPRERSAS
jgi:DNA-directed RNA polymerase subunit RPC12/RpoP